MSQQIGETIELPLKAVKTKKNVNLINYYVFLLLKK